MSRNRTLDQVAAVFLNSVSVLNFQGLKLSPAMVFPAMLQYMEIIHLCGLEVFQNEISKHSKLCLNKAHQRVLQQSCHYPQRCTRVTSAALCESRNADFSGL